MLSYQHLYHAGNMADVHKHAALAWALDYMTAKSKPLTYVETHAGRGLYDLDSPEARRTGEAASGIDRVDAAGWFGADHPYARVLARVRAQHGPRAYPGSPAIAEVVLRHEDRMHLAELHPQEYAALRRHFGARAQVCREDGFALARRLLPPTPGRGLMLIDPSWETKADYADLPDQLRRLHKRWPVGVVLLWYPLLSDARHAPLVSALQEALPQGTFHEVGFAPPKPGHRLVGSGLFILNAPYGWADEAARLSALFDAVP